MQLDHCLDKAATLIKQADSVLITAGAGMGVDSGLPDFRGDKGFWKAYPALEGRGMRFIDVANPRAIDKSPGLAWGFYGHRLKLYRNTEPHHGFQQLLEIVKAKPEGYFVYTSNVDGQFQKAGFDRQRIVECHGSIHHLQCTQDDCSQKAIWPADDLNPVVDTKHCQLTNELPRCLICGAIARPNILMFGDANWNDSRTFKQQQNFNDWYQGSTNSVIVELGAGTFVATIRYLGEHFNNPLIRINPHDKQQSEQLISIPLGAKEGIAEIFKRL